MLKRPEEGSKGVKKGNSDVGFKKFMKSTLRKSQTNFFILLLNSYLRKFVNLWVSSSNGLCAMLKNEGGGVEVTPPPLLPVIGLTIGSAGKNTYIHT